jgi:hypothetical protein
MRIQLGTGLFCFILTASVRLVRKDFWEGMVTGVFMSLNN